MEQNFELYLKMLSSKTATPGGGGASGLCGAIGSALAGMVCNLTIGKPKYAQYEEELKNILEKAELLRKRLYDFAAEDEIAFEPLSKAYSLPATTEEEKAYKLEVMEKCLDAAAEVPMKIARAAASAINLHASLSDMGSKLAISDVGVGVAACLAGLEGAVLNVYINTKYMSDKAKAELINNEMDELLNNGRKSAEETYTKVMCMLR